MKKKNFILFILLALQNYCFSEEIDPIFAGTLLPFPATNMEPCHFTAQPYFFLTKTYGTYDKSTELISNKNLDQENLILYFQLGLLKKLDFTVLGNFASVTSDADNVFLIGDTLLLLGIQLAEENKKTWVPHLRLLIGENCPTGRHDRLDPAKEGIDGIGLGTYCTFFLLAGAKSFTPRCCNPINLGLNLGYILPTPSAIHGHSIFGGKNNTDGCITPGSQILLNLAGEYSLTKHWILGLDVRYEHQDRSTFDPRTSHSPRAGLPSSERLSLAPCLEYNKNIHYGFNAGVWFTVFGRNTDAFLSGVFTFFYFF